MKVELIEIGAVPDGGSAHWKVRALSIDGVSPALTALDQWLSTNKSEFKKIIKSLRFAAQLHRVTDEKFVKKCANPAYGDVYEARAHRGHARLMFFYSDRDDAVIVCTNDFWKNQANQNTAFGHCAQFKTIFEKHYHERPKERRHSR